MTHGLEVQMRHRPVLDPGFLPAVLWNRAYHARVRATRGSVELGIALVRQDGTTFTHKTRILPPTAAHAALNRKYVERLVKFLLWQKGGCTILVKGCDPVARMLAAAYTEKGLRAFDRDLVGRRMFGQTIEVEGRPREAPARARDVAAPRPPPRRLPHRLRPRRLRPQVRGGRRRQGRLLRRGGLEPVLREGPLVPLPGDQRHAPARGRPPAAHRRDRRQRGRRLRQQRAPGGLALPRHRRARLRPPHPRHLPRAAVLVGRGAVRRRERRRGDGARRLHVDEGERGPRLLDGDERRRRLRDAGRQHHLLAQRAGLRADRLPRRRAGRRVVGRHRLRRAVLLAAGGRAACCPRRASRCRRRCRSPSGSSRCRSSWPRATPGPGRSTRRSARASATRSPTTREFYDIENMLVLGRVTSGEGGDVILASARQVLKDEFPALADKIRLRTPDEKDKRHGQAIAAASLPVASGARRRRGGARRARAAASWRGRRSTRGVTCSCRDRTRTSSFPTAPPCRRRSGGRPTCASAPTRTTRSSWPSTGSPSASAARTAASPGVVVTNGAGSARTDIYADYTERGDGARSG